MYIPTINDRTSYFKYIGVYEETRISDMNMA